MIRFSRSEQDDLWRCPRRGYLGYRAGGHGWTKPGINWDLLIGSLTHDYALGLIHGAPLKLINETHEKEIAEGTNLMTDGAAIEAWTQARWLAECMSRGWLAVRWPRIVEDYEPIAVEEDWDVPINDQVTIMLRLDYLLRRRSDGVLKILDLKTTGIMSQGYLESWAYANQPVAYLTAASTRMGERVSSVILELLYKGRKEYDRETGSVKRHSPFTRAYQNEESGELAWDSSVARRKAWHPVDPTIIGVTAEEWVEMIPVETLADQYRTTEVYRSDADRVAWRRRACLDFQTVERGLAHLDVAHAESTPEVWEMVLDERFPAHRGADCHEDKYRGSCPFKSVCFGEIALDDIAEHYDRRVPHHKREVSDGN